MPFIKLQAQITAVCGHVLNSFSHIRLFVTLWVVARQAPLSMGFSRQDYWSGLLRPPPGDLPDPGIKQASPASPALQADFLSLSHHSRFHLRIILSSNYSETLPIVL